MTTVLVTGAAGFVGRAVARELAARGHRVVGLDTRGGAGDGAPVAPVVGSVADVDLVARLLAEHAVDVVVHTAGVVGVDNVAARLREAAHVDAVGTATLLDAARAAGVARFVQASSEEVYGARPAAGSTIEDAPLDPCSAYGAFAVLKETMGRTALGGRHVAARISWAYGAGFPRSRPPQPWLDDAAAGRRSAPTAGGDHVVDLVHVDDVARGIAALVEAPVLPRRAYNLGAGAAVTLRAVARELRRLRPGWDVDLAGGPLPGIAPRGALDVTAIALDCGWAPALSLADGLAAALHPEPALPHERPLETTT